MLCKNCKGVGYIIIDSPYMPYHEECWECNGKGVVEPLTNEEYIRNASTEELAEAITDLIKRIANAKEVELNINKEAWIRWLKEVHTDDH